MLDTICIFFFLKNVTDDLNECLVAALKDNKYCIEKDDYVLLVLTLSKWNMFMKARIYIYIYIPEI